MNQENLKKIENKIEEVLRDNGVEGDKVVQLTKTLVKTREKQDRELLASGIANKIIKVLSPFLTELIGKEFSPKIEVKVPEIIVPKIDVPIVNVPTPKVSVNVPRVVVPAPIVKVEPPKVVVKSKEFPKTIEVNGFKDFVKTFFILFKEKINVSLTGISKTEPLPVILTYNKEYYQALGAMGGSPSRIWLKNKSNHTISPATEDKQDDIKLVLDDIKTKTDNLTNDPATATKQLPDNHNVTVSNPTADPETGLATSAKQLADNHNVNVSNQISGYSTSIKQDNAITELQKLIGFEITKYDYIALTYVAAGDGEGEIETVVYKIGGSGGTTVATLTLAYNASNEISSVTKT